MNPGVDRQFKRDKIVAIAAALFLHAVVLYGLWNYRIIPPQSEALAVFVSIINPGAPATVVPPQPVAPRAEVPKTVATKPAPGRQEAPRVETTAASLVSTKPTPVTVSAESTTLPLSGAGLQPAPSPVSLSAVTRPVGVSAESAGAPPVLLNGELSVSCTERTPPAYPKQSLRLGEQGKTIMQVELDELGRVVKVAIKKESGFPRLDEAAIKAVKTWRCNPAKQNGIAVRSVALQPFNFTLQGR